MQNIGRVDIFFEPQINYMQHTRSEGRDHTETNDSYKVPTLPPWVAEYSPPNRNCIPNISKFNISFPGDEHERLYSVNIKYIKNLSSTPRRGREGGPGRGDSRSTVVRAPRRRTGGNRG